MLLQTHSHTLRPLTTAHLAQTMTLLSLSAVELRQKIEAELASNPALELVEESRCPACRRRLSAPGPCPVCSRPKAENLEQPIVFVSPREDFYTPRDRYSVDDLPDEDLAIEVDDLPTYVLRQIAPEIVPDDRILAAHILTGLDEDGLLTTPLAEIARYHHVLPSRLEDILHVIQRADPIGVGSRSPQEALLVQLDVLAETGQVPALAVQAVQHGMDLLSRRQYIELGRLLHISPRQAREIASFISDNLNPFPGRSHWGDIHASPGAAQSTYHHPDVIITMLRADDEDSPLVVEIVSPLAGSLRVNPLFREALQEAPPDKTEHWQADLEKATLLVKCLQQRNHTFVRLMQRIAAIQRPFILHGDAFLEPLTRASLAGELEVHESTISRAVSSKAVQLPNGRIVPLSKMFDRSLHIRTALRKIIAQEIEPLTDTQIAELLEKEGYPVARRTVSKYRAMEGILPAHLRFQPHLEPQLLRQPATLYAGAK
jgi:RNA polymerase sigma-54 factor